MKKSSLKDTPPNVPSLSSVQRKYSSTGENSEKGDNDKEKLSDFNLQADNSDQFLKRKVHREIEKCNFILNETLQQVSMNRKLLFNLLFIIQMRSVERTH